MGAAGHRLGGSVGRGPARLMTARRNQRGPSTPNETRPAWTVAGRGPAGIALSSSSTTSAFHRAAMLAAISVRMSSPRRPGPRGGEGLELGDQVDRCRRHCRSDLLFLLLHLEAQLMPSAPGSRRAAEVEPEFDLVDLERSSGRRGAAGGRLVGVLSSRHPRRIRPGRRRSVCARRAAVRAARLAPAGESPTSIPTLESTASPAATGCLGLGCGADAGRCPLFRPPIDHCSVRLTCGRSRPGSPKPPLAPCPVSPRVLAGSESRTSNSTLRHPLDDRLGDPVAAADRERLAGSRLTRLTGSRPGSQRRWFPGR